MLKTSGSTKFSTQPGKSEVEVSSNSKAECDGRCKLDRRETDENEVDNEVDDEVGKKGQQISKSKNLFKKLSKSKKIVRSDFLILRARLIFTKLRKTFVKALILHHFDLKCHIRVETDT